MNRATRFIPLLLLIPLILVGCRESQQESTDTADLLIDIAYEPDPPSAGEATLLVFVTDADGSAVDDATVEVLGDMTHAGMMPELREIEGGEDGLYRVPFTWTMGGDWILTVTATLPDGASAEREFEVFNVASRRPQPPADSFRVTLETASAVPQVGEDALVISVTDAEGQAVTDARVRVQASHNDIGVDAIDLAPVTAFDDGLYRPAITWTAPGDWFLVVTVELADGRTVEREFDLFDLGSETVQVSDCTGEDEEACALELPTPDAAPDPLALPGSDEG